MKVKDEIERKISELQEEVKYWKLQQSNYKWSDHERINGSIAYGNLQENESKANQKIELLKWVLS